MNDWEDIRKNYPLVEKYTYLDTARTGALSRGTASEIKAHIDDFLLDGALNREKWIEVKEAARKKVSQVLNVDKSDVGFLTDVSTGMSFLASGMKPYRRVLLIEHDFPSVGIPWIRAGYDISWIQKSEAGEIDLHAIERQFEKGIDLISISWVQYNSGFKIELDKLSKLCGEYEVLLVVDGTQGFCAQPLDLGNSGIDVFMASAFKWVTAGYGVSVLYLNEELRSKLSLPVGGWNSLIDFFGSWENEGNYKKTTEFVELAHPKYSNLIALDHALGNLMNIGLLNIWERVTRLSDYLQKSLQDAGIETLSNYAFANSSGIRLMRGSKELFHHLKANNVSMTFRDDYFRLATHFYNQEDDVDSLITTIKEFERQ